MLIQDVMTHEVVTAVASTSVSELIDHMLRYGVTGLPVIDDERRVIGVVTETDVVARQGYGRATHRGRSAVTDLLLGRRNRWIRKTLGMDAGALMSRPVHTVRATESVASAAARMVTFAVKRLPVVDASGHLVGVVSQRDLLRLFDRSDATIQAEVDDTLADPVRCPEVHGVTASVQSGVVTLSGWTRDLSDLELVETMMRGVTGVLDVVDDEVTAVEPTTNIASWR